MVWATAANLIVADVVAPPVPFAGGNAALMADGTFGSAVITITVVIDGYAHALPVNAFSLSAPGVLTGYVPQGLIQAVVTGAGSSGLKSSIKLISPDHA